MIKFQNEDKTLTVPSGLGNFPSSAGGGSDVTRQDVIGIVNSAITEYDIENEVELEEIRENVSGNTEDIAAHGAALSDIRSDVDALSGTARDIRWNVDSISARTIANTADISALSAATEGIEGTVRSVVSDVATVSGQTSANTAYIAALSGVVETNELAISNLENYTQNDLAPAIGGIGTDLAALSGQVETLSSSTVTGLETAQNAANSADTKASSAYTLADSAYTRADAAYNLAESLTGGTGGPTTYVLNFMTQQERAALYTELAAYRWTEQYLAISSGFPVQDYAFYFYAGSETSDGWNDGDRGFVPLQLAAIHPDDYGGALFFTGTVKSRQGNNEILWVRYIVTSTGEVDKSTGINNWYDPPGAAEIQINSDGSIRSEESWTLNNITDSSIAFRTWLAISDGTGNGRGQVLNWNSISEEVDTDVWTDVYYFSALIPVGTTTYKGQWRVYRINDEWDSNHFAPISWTAQ